MRTKANLELNNYQNSNRVFYFPRKTKKEGKDVEGGGYGRLGFTGSYRGVKLLEYAMKIVERVLERRIRTIVNLNEMQFEFIPCKGTVNAIFIVRRMQEEYQKKDKKLYMCFVDVEKAFDGVPRKVMKWTTRKKGLSKVMVRAVMILHDGQRQE